VSYTYFYSLEAFQCNL